MLFGPAPRDRQRFPANYAAGLTPLIMGQLFDAADRGELGPLNELAAEVWGKDTFVGGPIGDRLASGSDVDLWIGPAPDDPSQARASETTLFLETHLAKLRLLKFERWCGVAHPVEEGELTECLEVFNIPWWYGKGIYWPYWETPWGSPKPIITGVEFVDPRRYRTARVASLYDDEGLFLETESDWQGMPLSQVDPLCWFTLSAARAGQRASLAGVARGLVFWWWMRINGAFSLSRVLEKWGIPNIIGEAAGPHGGALTAKNRADLDEFLESYQSDVSALFPPGFKAVILQAVTGAADVHEQVDRVTKSAILFGINGNEVTSTAQGAGAGGGVAGGAGSVGERIEARLRLSDRRREVLALRHIARRLLAVWYPGAPCPVIKLLDRTTSPESATQGTNPAPAAVPRTAPAPGPQPAVAAA